MEEMGFELTLERKLVCAHTKKNENLVLDEDSHRVCWRARVD